jgi:hypothetical protein
MIWLFHSWGLYHIWNQVYSLCYTSNNLVRNTTICLLPPFWKTSWRYFWWNLRLFWCAICSRTPSTNNRGKFFTWNTNRWRLIKRNCHNMIHYLESFSNVSTGQQRLKTFDKDTVSKMVHKDIWIWQNLQDFQRWKRKFCSQNRTIRSHVHRHSSNRNRYLIKSDLTNIIGVLPKQSMFMCPAVHKLTRN